MPYILQPLPYSYDALEPYIDARTMEIHYTKHHQGYVDNLNKALAEYPDLMKLDVIELLKSLDSLPEPIRLAVKNHGGGYINHTFFWEVMAAPSLKKGSRGMVREAIDRYFGSFDRFQELFNKEATGRFGSGWVWLVSDDQGVLSLISTANQDSPYLQKKRPLLGLDVWEHAYYLLYQNRRPEYITAWWQVVNWDKVEENYRMVLGR